MRCSECAYTHCGASHDADNYRKLYKQWNDKARDIAKENTRLQALVGKYRKLLKDVVNSEVVKNAPFASYSEALDRAREALEGDGK